MRYLCRAIVENYLNTRPGYRYQACQKLLAIQLIFEDLEPVRVRCRSLLPLRQLLPELGQGRLEFFLFGLETLDAELDFA
jgi:hypothetical protein